MLSPRCKTNHAAAGIGEHERTCPLSRLNLQIHGMPEGLTKTGCAYGLERKTLFIIESSSGAIPSIDLPVAGPQLYPHA
jgi:5,10-methenyltetrahydromethanopterin hydrogenase